ncbi:unnamed protein product [Merluccius merluccius]
MYLKAAMLDPAFGSMWVTHDVLVPDDTKEEVSKMIKDLILNEAVKVATTTPRVEEEEEVQETEPQSSLFGSYHKKRQKKDSASTPHMQLTQFLGMCDGQEDCLHFWTLNRHTLPSLFKVVSNVCESLREVTAAIDGRLTAVEQPLPPSDGARGCRTDFRRNCPEGDGDHSPNTNCPAGDHSFDPNCGGPVIGANTISCLDHGSEEGGSC